MILSLTTLFAGAILAGPVAAPTQGPKLEDLNGVWVYVEDRTEGRTQEQIGPPMDSTFSFKIEAGAVVLVTGHGGARRGVKVELDQKPQEVPTSRAGEAAFYTAAWKNGVFTYQIEFVRTPGAAPDLVIKREFRLTQEGMIVRSNLGTGKELGPIALYRHPEDIPLATPIKATISDVAWLAGTWVGTRGTGGAISFEERWSPPKGGSMFATSRTVAREKLSAFEYLRIIERDGGLVYVAQPNGGTATEFIMTEFSASRAVFDNPRHDYPKRIAYELSSTGGLTATIGFLKGGTPRRFEFQREVVKN